MDIAAGRWSCEVSTFDFCYAIFIQFRTRSNFDYAEIYTSCEIEF